MKKFMKNSKSIYKEYDKRHKNKITPYTRINWEHLKLVFFPILLFAILEYFFLKNNVNNYFIAKFIAIVFAICFIIIFFYTYTGIIGRNYFILDILSFVLAIIFAELIAYRIMLLPEVSSYSLNNLTLVAAIILAFFFVLFTYLPLKIQLFQDPVTKQYGIEEK